jgi:membrane protein implicated in regulation of membrane protease activity
VLASRQFLARLAMVVAVLFVIAAAFNDHSSTSVDGIIWWVAIGGFVLLLVTATVVLVGFVRSRAKRPRRARRSRAR